MPQAVDAVFAGELPPREGASAGLGRVAQAAVVTGAGRVKLDRVSLVCIEMTDGVADLLRASLQEVRMVDKGVEEPLEKGQDGDDQCGVDQE